MIVPLIRMNWRSRPTWSSIRRAASLPSQRSIVSVMTVVSSSPYRLDQERRRVGDVGVDPAAERLVVPELVAELGQRGHRASLHCAVGGVQGLDQGAFDRVPQRGRGGRDLRLARAPAA